jgi:hypothetical protein
MSVESYRKEAAKTIDDYLKGDITAGQASDWALEIVKTRDLKEFPKELAKAIHLIFDLHDEGESWSPSQDELRQAKDELEKLDSGGG